MEDPTSKIPRLNIFALPDQTTIMVVILIATMFAAMVGISANAPLAVFWPLTLALLVLSLRDLLGWPERELRRWGCTSGSDRHAVVQQRIDELSRRFGLRRAPRLWITPKTDLMARAIGGLKRHYIVIGATVADNLAEYLDGSAEEEIRIADALLLHELAHFRHGDILRFGYVAALLRVGLLLIGWAALFLLGWLLLLAIAGREMVSYSAAEIAARFDAALPGLGFRNLILKTLPSPEEWEAFRARAATLNMGLVLAFAFANTAPLAVASGTLLALLWNKLMRVREFYADAGVAHAQGTIAYLLGTPRLASVPLHGEVTPTLNGSHSWWTRIADSFQKYLNESLAWLGRTPAGQLWIRIFGTHNVLPRREALDRPDLTFDRGLKREWLFGFVVLTFELLLMGTSALFYIGTWPMHVPALVAFVLLALALMVDIVIEPPITRTLVRMIGITLVPHTVLVIVTLGLLTVGALLSPTSLAAFFNNTGAVIGGYVGFIPDYLLTKPEEMPGLVLQMAALNLVQPLVMFGVLLAALEILRRALARMLSWYGQFESPRDWKQLGFRLIGASAFVLVVAVLPLLTELALARFEWTTWHLVGVALGVMVVMGMVGWFITQDRRYAGRCPNCNKQAPGSYEFRRRCPECGDLLNPWLFASYEAEPRRRRSRIRLIIQTQEPHVGIEEL